MRAEHRQKLLSLVALADQLVADAYKWMNTAPDPEASCIADDMREMLVVLRARIEATIGRYAQ